MRKRRTKTAGEINAFGEWAWPLLLLAYAVVAGYAVWLLPEFLVDSSLTDVTAAELTAAERTAAITAARQVVLLAAGGLLGVITLALTQRRDAVARARHEIERDANRTTRYTEAVKQLGDDKAAVRFGGIYALGRIGEDSERDRQTILQVLMAYIREAAPVTDGSTGTHGVDEGSSDSVLDPEDAHARDSRELQVGTARAAAEVMASLSRSMQTQSSRVVLTRTDLRSADLRGAAFVRGMFLGSDLSHADLSKAQLSGSLFVDASLSYTDFRSADLENANFIAAHAPGAILSLVYAVDANFTGAYLPGARFRDTTLNDAKLVDANLESAVFDGARLVEASLSGANLENASFNGADLRGADLRGTKTAGASFRKADLRDIKYNGLMTDLGDITGATFSERQRQRLP